jgi:dTDP-4-amino-4,6-dideoxygalactose transaminase
VSRRNTPSLERGWTGLAYKTVEFEQAWCAHAGLPHAHFLNSATSGLHLAMNTFKEADGWSDGEEVITSPVTFVSTNHAILYERPTTVSADINEYLCLDSDHVERKISARTRAMIFLGIGGSSGRFDRIRELCPQRGFRLILDAAHMAGSRLDGATPQGDATVYSFQAVKCSRLN